MIPATTSVSTDALSSKLDELDTISFFCDVSKNVIPILFPDRLLRERENINAYEFRVYPIAQI